MFLLSEVLSPKGLPIKASPQSGRYFNPGSQASLQRILSDSAHILTRGIMGKCERYEDDVKKHVVAFIVIFIVNFLRGREGKDGNKILKENIFFANTVFWFNNMLYPVHKNRKEDYS